MCLDLCLDAVFHKHTSTTNMMQACVGSHLKMAPHRTGAAGSGCRLRSAITVGDEDGDDKTDRVMAIMAIWSQTQMTA